MLGVPSSRPSCFRGPFAGRVRARARGRARARRARSCARRRVPRRAYRSSLCLRLDASSLVSSAARSRSRARAPRLRDRGLRRGDRPRRVLLRGREARAARLQRGVAEARVRAEPARVHLAKARIQRRRRLERRATRVRATHRRSTSSTARSPTVSASPAGAFRAQRLDGRVPRRAADAETLRDLRERRARAVEERHVRVGRRGAPGPRPSLGDGTETVGIVAAFAMDGLRETPAPCRRCVRDASAVLPAVVRPHQQAAAPVGGGTRVFREKRLSTVTGVDLSTARARR